MRTYLVSEERFNETALFLRDIKLAEVKDEEVYVYIDDVDYFTSVEECDNAEEDVKTFLEAWKIRAGYKMHTEE